MPLRFKVLAAPCLVFIIIMAVTLGLRRISHDSINANIIQSTRENCYNVSNLLQANLRERVTAIRQLANYFRVSDRPSEEVFRGQCRFAMRQAPEILAIAVTDAARKPIWVEGASQISNQAIETMMHDSAMASALEQAIRLREYSLTEKLLIPGHGEGFAVLIPYHDQNRLKGFIFGFFLHSKLLNALLLPELRGGFDVELRQANQRIYNSYLFSAESRLRSENPHGGLVSVVEDFFLVGPQLWTVKVRSSGLSRLNPAYFTSEMILILGTILAILVSAFVYDQQWRLARFQTDAWVSRSRLASTGLSLAQIQENFDLILNNVNEGIILFDEEWAPLQANVAFKNAFGTPGKEAFLDLPEQHHAAMSALFRDDTQYWELMKVLKENPNRPVTDEIETKGPAGGSGGRIYQRRAAAVTRPDGSRRGYMVLYQDVTLARNAERLKEDFLSSVTHDLRTPLASIKGFAETILHDPAMGSDTRDEFASIIRDESTRLEEMIEDLLDLRRMEEGQFDLAPSSYNLRALVDEVVRTSRPILDAHAIRTDIQWEGESGEPLAGDVAKMGRALRNILGNSVKYSPHGSTITIRGFETSAGVRLEVADEGPGIPEHEIPFVFEKFYRGAHHVRRTQGTGLGLAIVKHIVESHGGKVTIFNGPEKGAVIRMDLPREGAGEDERGDRSGDSLFGAEAPSPALAGAPEAS